jgi:hypothetical protein
MPHATRHPGAILAAFAIRAVLRALEMAAAQAGPCPGHCASAGYFALRRPGHGPAVDVLCALGMIETMHGKGLYVRR